MAVVGLCAQASPKPVIPIQTSPLLRSFVTFNLKHVRTFKIVWKHVKFIDKD